MKISHYITLWNWEKKIDQQSTIGWYCVSRYAIPAKEGCMQGEIILSSIPSCSPNHPHVLWIIKKKNSFYGFTSQQPRYAFVKIGGKLEPHVNLNGRHLVMIRAMLQMMETHSGLYLVSAQWTGQYWLRSEAYSGHICCVYEQIRALMDSKESPRKQQIFHKL